MPHTKTSQPVVYVVHDDAEVRERLVNLLRGAGQSVRAFATADSFLASCDGSQAGCAVVALALAEGQGPDVRSLLRDRGVHLPLIFVSRPIDVPTAVRIMRAGAIDVIPMPAHRDSLLAAVNRALAVDAERRAHEAQRRDAGACISRLTEREQEVLHHMLCGASSREIGVKLGLKRKTVDVHRSHILQKTGAPTLTALIRLAHTAGIMTSPDYPNGRE